MKLQIARRCVQIATMIVVVAMALLSLYAHYRAAGVIDDPQLMQGLRGETMTRLIHPLVDTLDDPQALLDNNYGTLWSMRLMGVELSDPLAAVETIATSKIIHWPMLASILIPVGLTVLLGRVFCSWICPAYVLFELAGKLRKLLKIAEIEPGEVKFAHTNKYLFLIAGLIVAAIASAPLFALIYPPAVLSRIAHAWVFGTALTGMLVLVGIILAVEVLVSPRWWCRTMCPGGALYALLGWVRPLRVKLVADRCSGCKDCLPVCEAGINPIMQSSSIECDNCGVCINYCRPRALYFTIGLPDRAPKQAGNRSRLAQTLARITGVFALLAVTSPVRGHHILGLPHYSYKESYPQRPTLEYPATTGPYDILLTSYPGIPTPGETANLAFYIKNRVTGTVYADPISVRVLRTSTFGDNDVIMPPTQRAPFDNQHKFRVTFPHDAEYVVELSVDVEGRTEVIPFLFIAGAPTATSSIVVACVFGAVFGFVLLRAVQRKRRRRPEPQASACAVLQPEPQASTCAVRPPEPQALACAVLPARERYELRTTARARARGSGSNSG